MESKWQVPQVTELQGETKTMHESKLKTRAAGTLNSNHFLQQSCWSGGNAAPPTPVRAQAGHCFGRHYCPRAHSAGHICKQRLQPKESSKKICRILKFGLSDMEPKEVVTPLPAGRIRPRSFFRQKQAPFYKRQYIMLTLSRKETSEF